MVSPPPATASVSRTGLWIQVIGAGLTACLAVLFLVVLQRVQEQTRSLDQLERRLLTLENLKALERTNTLEQQLRATVARLQALEGLQGSMADLTRQQQIQGEQLQRLASRPPSPFDGSGMGDESAPSPRPPATKPPRGRPPAARPAIEPASPPLIQP
jgi:TolA-binding protein